jgi:hypothetical protein
MYRQRIRLILPALLAATLAAVLSYPAFAAIYEYDNLSSGYSDNGVPGYTTAMGIYGSTKWANTSGSGLAVGTFTAPATSGLGTSYWWWLWSPTPSSGFSGGQGSVTACRANGTGCIGATPNFSTGNTWIFIGEVTNSTNGGYVRMNNSIYQQSKHIFYDVAMMQR